MINLNRLDITDIIFFSNVIANLNSLDITDIIIFFINAMINLNR